MDHEIERQIERNKRRTIVLAVAAVVNASALALILSLAARSPLPTVIMFLTTALWLFAAYRMFERTLLRGLAIRPLTIRERHRLLPRLDGVVQQMGIAPPRLLVQSDPMPNALAFGAGARATIIVTEGLLELLDDDELEGVLAHECAHVANHDTEIAALSAALLGWAIAVAFLVTLLATGMLAWGLGMLSGGDDRDREVTDMIAGAFVGILLITLAVVTWIGVRLWLLISELTHLAISREREWLADATAARTTGKPLALASALEKAAAVRPVLTKHDHAWAESLMIVGRSQRRWWGELFATHPDIAARVACLRSYGTYGTS